MSKHPREIVEAYENLTYSDDTEIDEARSFLVNSHIETLEAEIARLKEQYKPRCRCMCEESNKAGIHNQAIHDQISHLQQQLSEWRLMK